jgi:flotillin
MMAGALTLSIKVAIMNVEILVGGDGASAVKFIIADKLEQLVQMQVDAIKNIKIDKVTVWDGMGGGTGTPATANFLAGMLKSIPPMNELFKQAGMELPPILGSDREEAPVQKEA